ncbi:MAG TPA: phytanoyl-CoA dioxygenase family protein, partial [Bacilli bacterium]
GLSKYKYIGGLSMGYAPKATQREDRYMVKVDEYAHYHGKGYLIVRGLIEKQDVERLQKWEDDLYYGHMLVPGLDPLDTANPTPEQLANRIAGNRIHMLHRKDHTAEWGLLHPRVLDVAEALVGPDVIALQSMVFFNPPGRGGQGWHQDSFYIRTFPDTLVGAWIALDVVDEENGCLWVASGSHAEPIYPPFTQEALANGSMHAHGAFADLFLNSTASNSNDDVNELTKVAAKYGNPVPGIMHPGDVLFFHSHLLHRSFPNKTADRFRRSYVCHYSNARSWIPWNHGEPFEGDAANEHHILARGATHLPYAKPVFGTPVDLNQDPYSL